jgi:YHS domain-containing protein
MRIAPFAVIVPFVLAACGGEPEPAKAPPPAAVTGALATLEYQETSPTAGYPLKTCVVSGKPLTASRYTISYRGYEVQFCSKECLKEFAEGPETYVTKAYPKAIFRDGK